MVKHGIKTVAGHPDGRPNLTDVNQAGSRRQRPDATVSLPRFYHFLAITAGNTRKRCNGLNPALAALDSENKILSRLPR